MRIGILFGGPSREREISFAGGRTVYDNLNKSLFTPVPIFIDSFKNFILLDWQYVYKGSIRDFFPPIDELPPSPNHFQVYLENLGELSIEEQERLINKIGRKIMPAELKEHIDFAFLALHGYFGEDGTIQGLLESFEIPYSGSGILPSAIGMNKAIQKKLMQQSGFATPDFNVIRRKEWQNEVQKKAIYNEYKDLLKPPYVVRPANQGSSIGVSIINEEGFEVFEDVVNKGFFILKLEKEEWRKFSEEEQINYVRTITDIREGVGLPLEVNDEMLYHPEEVLTYIKNHFSKEYNNLTFKALDGEPQVVVEDFIEGKEFSCIVVKGTKGEAIALPPTEIIKGKEVFDYRSKYLPGLSRKITPIKLPNEQINAIRHECEQLFNYFGFNVYARIDGFIQEDGTIYLNDPNTTSGMLPSSFFFHQAAEIGLNPSQFLTYIIRTSIEERINTLTITRNYRTLLKQLDKAIVELQQKASQKTRIGVILGGYSSERHISVESGRNIYEKLASSEKYEAIPVFLTGSDENIELYQIPINLLLKDNADDIKDKIEHFKKHAVIEDIKKGAKAITDKYTIGDYHFEPVKLSFDDLAAKVDGVFIALHGRPGEDGHIQSILEQYNIPFNGSTVASSQITINKFETNEILRNNGFKVAKHDLISKDAWQLDKEQTIGYIEKEFNYPFIAKPVDDGCSSAVKKVKNRQELIAFFNTMFREADLPIGNEEAKVLKLKPKEEFPWKQQVLVEELIEKGGAKHFMEITGGMLTHRNDSDEIEFEVFEPSEALAGEEVLSLEEKFLAGQGQNITPARFGKNSEEYKAISKKVKEDLKRVAEVLEVQGYCRIDAFVRIYENGEVETIIIEVNSLPGMTPATCIFHQAAINDYKPFDFIDKILEFGFQRNKTKLGSIKA